MKRILSIILVLSFVQSYGQKTPLSLGTKNTIVTALSDFRVDSLLFLPERDTTFTPSRNGAVILKQSDSSLYYWAKYWRPMGGAFVKSVYKRGDSLFYQRGSSEYFVAKWGIRAFTVPTGLTATQIGDSISITTALNGLIIGNGNGLGAATVQAPLYFLDGRLWMARAGVDSSGYLSLTDWQTFNAKIDPSRQVATSGSLTGGGALTQDRVLTLVGDNSAPGPWKYYGTNGAGAKGFFNVPGYVDSVQSVFGRKGHIVPQESDYSNFYAPKTHSHLGLIPIGGFTGQVLKKLSDNDYDVVWENDNNSGGSGGGTGVDTLARMGDTLMFRKNLVDYFIPDAFKRRLYAPGNGISITQDSIIALKHITVTADSNILIGTSVNDGHKLKVNGPVRFDVGSDAQGDTYYRDGFGSLTRLPKPSGITNPVLSFDPFTVKPYWKQVDGVDSSVFATRYWAGTQYVPLTGYNKTNWDLAYSWGNHSGLYRPITYVPTFSEILSKPTTINGYGITDAYTQTQLNNFFSGATAISGYNKSNWDAAYGWGNHASAGYLTNITGKVQAGTNVTITGAGTTAAPYVVNASVLDTTSLSNRINGKLNISDTSTKVATRYWVLQQGYGTGAAIDTTSLSSRINTKADYPPSDIEWVIGTTSEAATSGTTILNFTGTGDWQPVVYRGKLKQSKIDDGTGYYYSWSNGTLTLSKPLQTGELFQIEWRRWSGSVVFSGGVAQQPSVESASIVSIANSPTSQTLSWAEVSGATGYELQRDVSADFTAPSTIYSGSNTYYTDNTATAGGIYYYRYRKQGGTTQDWEATQSVSPYALEMFDGTQGVTLSGWTIASGNYSYDADQLAFNKGAASEGIATKNIGASDYTIYANIRSNSGAAIIFRYVDNNNFLFARYHTQFNSTQPSLQLYKRVGGTTTLVTSQQVNYLSDTKEPHELKVTASGSSVSVTLQHYNITISGTITDFQTATAIGLRSSSDGGTSFINDNCGYVAVFPQSVAQTQFKPYGILEYFQEPVAIRYTGKFDRTYESWVNRWGDVCVRWYDHRAGKYGPIEVVDGSLMAEYGVEAMDDHNPPALHFLPDGRLMVFYNIHDVNNAFFSKTTAAAEDLTTFATRKNIADAVTAVPYNYQRPITLSDGSIVLFYRRGSFANSGWYYKRSTDNGVTWSSPVTLADNTPDGIYGYVAQNPANPDEVHMAGYFSYDQDDPPTRRNIWYVKCANLRTTDTWTKSTGAAQTLPINHSNAEFVLNGTTAGLVTDIIVYNNKPYIAYGYDINPNHKLKYAELISGTWTHREITASRVIYDQIRDGQLTHHYTPGVIFNPANPYEVVLWKDRSGVTETEVWESTDNGVTWAISEQITTGSVYDNWRGQWIKNAASDHRFIWNGGGVFTGHDGNNWYGYDGIRMQTQKDKIK